VKYAAFLVAVLVTGCYAQVPVRAPRRTLTAVERIAIFQAYRPVAAPPGDVRTQLLLIQRRREGILDLANGTVIHDPSQLLPLVPRGSVTAMAARRIADVRESERVLAGIVLAGVMVTQCWDCLPAPVEDREAAALTELAYQSFEQDLKARLYLCSDATLVFPCESPPPP